jgi:hypothetical protein
MFNDQDSVLFLNCQIGDDSVQSEEGRSAAGKKSRLRVDGWWGDDASGKDKDMVGGPAESLLHAP